MTFTIALLCCATLNLLSPAEEQQPPINPQMGTKVSRPELVSQEPPPAQAEYQRAMRLLDERKYEEAVKQFEALVAQQGKDVDRALYWQAFSEAKLGEKEKALKSLDTLKSLNSTVSKRWKSQAAALEMELKGQRKSKDKGPSREAEKLSDDDQLKLIALDGLMQSDPEKALPAIEKVLAGNAAPRIKERALFLLTQSGNPKARELLMKAARDNANPDLQIRAIRMLGFLDKESNKLLGDLYNENLSKDARLNLLRGMRVSQDRERLLAILKTEKTPELRREAIRQLARLGEKKALADMYAGEPMEMVRREILQSLAMTQAFDEVAAILRAEKDPALQARGVQSLAVMSRNKENKEKVTALLREVYGSGSPEVKRAAVDVLMAQGDAKALIEMARKETDPELKKRLVQRLASMGAKEANDLFVELLSK